MGLLVLPLQPRRAARLERQAVLSSNEFNTGAGGTAT